MAAVPCSVRVFEDFCFGSSLTFIFVFRNDSQSEHSFSSSFRYPNESPESLPKTVKWRDIVGDPANKCTYLTLRSKYYSDIKREYGRFAPSASLLEENVVTLPHFMIMPRLFPYTETFKMYIDHMITAGLTQKWHEEDLSTERDETLPVEEFEPQVLSVVSLKIGFLAFLIAVVISSLAFLVELAVKATKYCALSIVMHCMIKTYVKNHLRHQIQPYLRT